jgi:phospholipid/cholesterol/gamma-HCH transport system substrate-binding protein
MPDRRSLALQLRIGGFVLVSLAVFLAIIYLLGARARYFERKYELVAEFTEVGGLIEGATVRLAGVQIGRVTGVTLSPKAGTKVRVTMTVARRFHDRIRHDSEARIATQGLLGDKIVEITSGSPDAPPLAPGETLTSREAFEMGRVLAEGAGTLAAVNQLVSAVRAAVDRLDKSGAVDDLGAAASSARRITNEVEKGRGWLHVLVYEEPEALRRLNAILISAEGLMARTESGESAVGVVLSKDSAKSGRALLAALDALGRAAEKPGPADGLLPALLFDPEYRQVARDLQILARNFRDVSEKLARGEGVLGGLIQGGNEDSMGQAGADVRAALANLRAVSEKLNAGEGTLGKLVVDPTLYESMVSFLEGAQRSFLLRALIRSTIKTGDRPKEQVVAPKP